MLLRVLAQLPRLLCGIDLGGKVGDDRRGGGGFLIGRLLGKFVTRLVRRRLLRISLADLEGRRTGLLAIAGYALVAPPIHDLSVLVQLTDAVVRQGVSRTHGGKGSRPLLDLALFAFPALVWLEGDGLEFLPDDLAVLVRRAMLELRLDRRRMLDSLVALDPARRHREGPHLAVEQRNGGLMLVHCLPDLLALRGVELRGLLGEVEAREQALLHAVYRQVIREVRVRRPQSELPVLGQEACGHDRLVQPDVGVPVHALDVLDAQVDDAPPVLRLPKLELSLARIRRRLSAELELVLNLQLLRLRRPLRPGLLHEEGTIRLVGHAQDELALLDEVRIVEPRRQVDLEREGLVIRALVGVRVEHRFYRLGRNGRLTGLPLSRAIARGRIFVELDATREVLGQVQACAILVFGQRDRAVADAILRRGIKEGVANLHRIRMLRHLVVPVLVDLDGVGNALQQDVCVVATVVNALVEGRYALLDVFARTVRYADVVAEAEVAIAVEAPAVVTLADGANFGFSRVGLDPTARHGNVCAAVHVSAAYAGSTTRAHRIDVSAVDGDGAARSPITAADAGTIFAALCVCEASRNADGTAVALVAAADAGAAFAARRVYVAARNRGGAAHGIAVPRGSLAAADAGAPPSAIGGDATALYLRRAAGTAAVAHVGAIATSADAGRTITAARNHLAALDDQLGAVAVRAATDASAGRTARRAHGTIPDDHLAAKVRIRDVSATADASCQHAAIGLDVSVVDVHDAVARLIAAADARATLAAARLKGAAVDGHGHVATVPLGADA